MDAIRPQQDMIQSGANQKICVVGAVVLALALALPLLQVDPFAAGMILHSIPLLIPGRLRDLAWLEKKNLAGKTPPRRNFSACGGFLPLGWR